MTGRVEARISVPSAVTIAVSNGVGGPWTLTKTGGGISFTNNVAYGNETFAGDGYMQMTPTQTGVNRIVGLSDSIRDASWGGSYPYSISFGGTQFSVLENFSSKTGFINYSSGDVFRIVRTGTTITYLQNGVVFYTSATASTGSLRFEFMSSEDSSSLARAEGVRMVDGVSEMSLSFVTANVTATPSTAIGAGTATLPAGSYYPTTLVSTLATSFATIGGGTWTCTLSLTTGLVTINCPGVASWNLTWSSTTLRDLLGFAADITGASSAQSGTSQARGLWFPDCPLTVDGDPRRAPKVSDLRTTISPTGAVLGLVGNSFRRHKNVRWSHVPKARVWDQAAAYPNGSWEVFFNDTQLGLGSISWFSPCSPILIYDHTGTQVGADVGLAWQITGVTGIEPPRSNGTNGWTGMFEILLPEIVASG